MMKRRDPSETAGATRLARIEHDLQAYGDGPPYYASPEDEAMGRIVGDVAWLHSRFTDLLDALEHQNRASGLVPSVLQEIADLRGA